MIELKTELYCLLINNAHWNIAREFWSARLCPHDSIFDVVELVKQYVQCYNEHVPYVLSTLIPTAMLSKINI